MSCELMAYTVYVMYSADATWNDSLAAISDPWGSDRLMYHAPKYLSKKERELRESSRRHLILNRLSTCSRYSYILPFFPLCLHADSTTEMNISDSTPRALESDRNLKSLEPEADSLRFRVKSNLENRDSLQGLAILSRRQYLLWIWLTAWSWSSWYCASKGIYKMTRVSIIFLFSKSTSSLPLAMII
jgi:hypothetical protein